MSAAKILRIKTTPEKKTRTVKDTIEFTRETLASWVDPPFQRPLRVNEKVLAVAEKIAADGGVIPGIWTLGVLNGVTYLIDGQHRINALKSTLDAILPYGSNKEEV